MFIVIIIVQVGIEDCLHIEFEYDKNQYHVKDVVIGKVYFLLVRIKIKYMELDIIRTETIKSGTAQHTETETVTKFEIMDGNAVKSKSLINNQNQRCLIQVNASRFGCI